MQTANFKTIVTLLRRAPRGVARRARAALRLRRFTAAPRTAAERRLCYERDGFVSGGPLLDKQQVERLREEFERIFADRTNRTNGAGRSDQTDWANQTGPANAVNGTALTAQGEKGAGIQHDRVVDPKGGEIFRVYNLHRLSEEFHALVTHPRLIEMLAELTGHDAFRVLVDQIQYKPPRTGGWNGWHRDMPSYPLIRPYTALAAWIPLDDATEENGCMQMVPGSHLWGDATDIAVNHWALGALPQVYHGHPVRAVSVPLRRGHVHFHHERTWHYSSSNKTSGKRRAIAIHYIGAEDRYRAGGPIVYATLSQGDRMDRVAPLLVKRGGGGSR